ncbi:hypothetical protein [Paenibacillus sp. NRS-1760]|uniref:hypothetical protein n=1 Tax=Paenibacillus sp. NRS-1760 TaxID=3233902 RepID=UPI003D29ECA4
MDFNFPGFKSTLRDDGIYEILFTPEELPFEYGVGVYEIASEFKFESLIPAGEKSPCFCIVQLENMGCLRPSKEPLRSGDTLVELPSDEVYNIVFENLDLNLFLLGNEHRRLGTLRIETQGMFSDFKNAQEIMFRAFNHVINMLSYTYGTPIRASSFFINYKVLNVFSLVEAVPKVKESIGKLVDPIGVNFDKWNVAVNHFRKALLASDPQSKFMGLYLACEMTRTLIKEKLNLEEDVKNITGKGYSEPKINDNHKINEYTTFGNLIGKKYSFVLYSIFRELRNASSHHILYDGSYKNISSLKDYLEFYGAVPYLIEIFEGYQNELNKLANS